jgi:acyl transferase domain-containing protein
MGTIAKLYSELVTPHLAPKPPQIPYFSTVYGRQILEGKVFGPAYWQLNMESPVLFRTAVSELLKVAGQGTAYLEIGPHSALAGPLRQIFEENNTSAPYTSALIRGKDSATTFLEALGKLFCFGMSPKVPSSVNETTLHDLPTYPWDHESAYWSETRVMSGWRFRKHRNHELLGQRALESSDLEPVWRNMLRLGTVRWLADHCVGSDIVFPAAGYIAMAGAAASQVAESGEGYTLRDVHVASALVLHESKATEIITTLRKQSLTTSLSSKWFEFSISSEINGIWTKHCSGLVTAGIVGSTDVVALRAKAEESFSRKVDANRWYTAMTRIGLNYGPRFVGLEEIACSPAKQIASVRITDVQDQHEPYALHPTTLDMMLQSWAVASSRGEYRLLTELFLPTFIEELCVSPAPGKRISVQSTATGLPGTAVGDSIGISDGELVFRLKGFKGTRMDGSFVQSEPGTSSLTLQWHPDIDFTDADRLIRPTRDMSPEYEILERLYALYALEIQEQLKYSVSPHPHLNLYHSWLEAEVKRFGEPGHSIIPDSKDLVAMDIAHRKREIAFLRQRSQHYPMSAAVEVYARTCANMVDIIEGRNTLLSVLVEDDLLAKFYNYFNDALDLSDFFQVVGLNKPQMRVLEIGAGTGGWTSHALRGLTSELGGRLYDEYTVTDISPGFLSQCKNRFSGYSNVEYALLDITQDPVEQGFLEGGYDLVIASNVRDNFQKRKGWTLWLTRDCRYYMLPQALLRLFRDAENY